jgi:hypothetical protein
LIDLVSSPVLYIRGRILLGGPADGNDEVQLTLPLLHTVENMFKTSFVKRQSELKKFANSVLWWSKYVIAKLLILRPRFKLIFLKDFFRIYYFICRPSESTVSDDAGIESTKTVATLA